MLSSSQNKLKISDDANIKPTSIVKLTLNQLVGEQEEKIENQKRNLLEINK